MIDREKMHPEKPIQIKAPKHVESDLNKNWIFIRNIGGGSHVERTQEAVGYQNADGDEAWIAPGSYMDKHPAILAEGYTDQALKTAIEDWIEEGGAEEKLVA